MLRGMRLLPPEKAAQSRESACHIHNVRLMWLGAADKSAKLSAKLDHERLLAKNVTEALSASAKLVQELLEKGLRDPAGKVPNFKPDVVAFTGYLIAHDFPPSRADFHAGASNENANTKQDFVWAYGSGERCGKSAGSNVDADLDVAMADDDFGLASDALLVTSGGCAAILQTAMEDLAIRHCAV